MLVRGEQHSILLMGAHRSNENRLMLLIDTNKVEASFDQKGNKMSECNTILEAQKETIIMCYVW